MPAHHRATRAFSLLAAGLVLLAPAASRAQEPATIEQAFEAGSAQVLARGGAALLTDLVLDEGVRDPVAGRLRLRFVEPDGKGTLSIVTPATPGAHAAQAKPPRGATVQFRSLDGLSGARGPCVIHWAELSPAIVSGSFTCSRERTRGRKPTKLVVVGTFVASGGAAAAPDAGGSPAPTVVPSADSGGSGGMPIYPVGVAVESAGQMVTPLAFRDTDVACVKAKGPLTEPCPAGFQPVAGAMRLVDLEVCVSLSGVPGRPLGKTGFSRTLFAGDPAGPVSMGLPVTVVDPAVTSRSLVGVALDQGTCVPGHAVVGSRGPLVVWLPPDGAPPVGWTLDPVALPPTSDGPDPTDPGATPIPSTGPVAGRVDYVGGAADVLHDGSLTAAADDLVLTEGWLETAADGSAQLHLAFSSAAGSALTVDVPSGEGVLTVPAGSTAPDRSVSYALPGVAVAAGEAACTVDVAPSGSGGVTGTWLCDVTAGGTGSGSFFANP